MAGSDSHIKILTLYINGLNIPIKKHGLANWVKSQNPSVYCVQETHLKCKETHRLIIKGCKKIHIANGEQKNKNGGVAILDSDKIEFKQTKVKRGKEGHFIMLKGSMHQEELMIPIQEHPDT